MYMYLLGRIDVLSGEYDILVAEVAQQHLDLASLQAPRASYPLIGLVEAYIRPVWWMVGGGWWVGGWMVRGLVGGGLVGGGRVSGIHPLQLHAPTRYIPHVRT